jgi:hypothetical protein
MKKLASRGPLDCHGKKESVTSAPTRSDNASIDVDIRRHPGWRRARQLASPRDNLFTRMIASRDVLRR